MDITASQWTIIYVTYGLAALLLLVIVVRGIRNGDSGAKIRHELLSPILIITGSLILLAVYIFTGNELAGLF